MKKRKTFKEIVSVVPKPKKLTPDTVLPSIFDTLWDCKTFGELTKDYPNLFQKQLRMLREHGFDTNDLQ
jgi:hypothetical protein